jgi:uncharacterized protein YndB with AHSA1/START domain
MADILHDLFIAAPPAEVFRAVSTPAGLDAWWTLDSVGEARPGAAWRFGFGPDCQWRGEVTAFQDGGRIAWRMTEADADWTGTTVALEVEPTAGGTRLRFAHAGWAEVNAHYRTSSYCWAMYLRVLRLVLEGGPPVAYGDRLDG